MRPHSIKLFAIAYLTFGVVMLLHGYLMRYRQDTGPVEFLGEMALPATLAIRFGVVLLLAWGVFFKVSKIAKWLVIVQVAGLAMRLPQAWGGIAEGNVRAIVWTFGFVVGVAAIGFLFMPDSRYWFASKGRSVKGDAAVFE